jgi:hypothetical protein
MGPRLKAGDPGVLVTRPDAQRMTLRIGLPLTVPPGRYTRQGHWQVLVRSQRPDGAVEYQVAAMVESLITFPSLNAVQEDGSISARVDFAGSPISHGEATLRPMSAREEYQEVALHAAAAPRAQQAVARVATAPQTRYLRVQATGRSPMGHPFVRERLMRMDELR